MALLFGATAEPASGSAEVDEQRGWRDGLASLRQWRLVRTVRESGDQASPSRRTRMWGSSDRADGASESVRRRRQATPSTVLGSVAFADDRIVLASREMRQTERDRRVDGVAEVGADSPTH